jgi:hypothetical protein
VDGCAVTLGSLDGDTGNEVRTSFTLVILFVGLGEFLERAIRIMLVLV